MSTITITFDAALLDITVNSVVYQLDLSKSIPNASLVEIFSYGAQRKVNDACGGKDKTDEKKAELAKAKIDAIYDGTIAERTRGSAEREAPINYYIREVLRKRMGDDTRKAYKACEAEDRAAFLMAKYEALAEPAKAAITALAQAMLDESLASANRVKKIDVTI